MYARGLEISEELIPLIVSRTNGVSAAFIKELMRRCAQLGGEAVEQIDNPPAAFAKLAVDS